MDGNLHLDWLSFSWKPSPDQVISEDIFECFRAAFPMLDPLFENATEFSGYAIYDVRFMCNYHIVVMYDSAVSSSKGLNISIPSQGLFLLYDLLHVDNALDLFLYLRSRGCVESRVDFAFDDYTKTFMPKDFYEWRVHKLMNTKFRSYRFFGSESDRGHTFQLGTRKSKKLLRIYDKDYQSHGEINSIRYEFEFHGIHARQMVDYVCSHNGCWFQDLINGWLRILDPDHDVENRTERRTLPAWKEFLELEFSEGKAVKLPGRTHVASLNTTAEWVVSVVPLVASSLYHAYGEDALLVLEAMAKDIRPYPDPKIIDPFYLSDFRRYIIHFMNRKFRIDFTTGEVFERDNYVV